MNEPLKREFSNDPDNCGNSKISAQDARGGEIILRTWRQRAIFVWGLIAFVLIAVVVRLGIVG